VCKLKNEIVVDSQVLIYQCLWFEKVCFYLKKLLEYRFFSENKNLSWGFALSFTPAYDVS